MHTRNTAIMAVILVGLAAFVYFHEIRGRDERDQAEKDAAKLVLFEPEEVTGLEVTTPDGAVGATRSDGTWRITAPRELVADGPALDRLVDALRTAPQERLIAENPEDLAPYGLDSPVVTLALALGPDRQLRVRLGKDTPIGFNLYAAVDGDGAEGTRVFAAPRDLRGSLEKKLIDLRDRTVIAFEQDAVRRLDLDTGGLSARLRREDGDDDEPRWSATSPFAGRADADSIDDLLSALSLAEAEAFVHEGAPDAELHSFYGLDSPLATVTLWTDDDASQTLILGGESVDPPGRFAARAGGDAVFVVASDLADDLPKSVDDLRNKQVLALQRERVQAIELRHGDVDARVERDGVDWTLTRPRALPADASAVSGLLSALQDLRAESFATGPGATELQVRLSLEAGDAPESLELLVGAPLPVPASDDGDTEAGTLRPVTVTGDDTVYLVPADDVEDLFADAFELRAKTLVEFDNSGITQLTLQTGDGGSWELTRSGDEWTAADGTEFESSLATDLLWDLNYLRMEQVGIEWQEETPALADFGLAPPRFRIVAQGAEGLVATVEIGGSVPGDEGGPPRTWTRVDDGTGVFAVTGRVADAAEALADALRKAP